MQIQCFSTDEEFQGVIRELQDWLADLGISAHHTTFLKKDDIVKNLIEHHLYNWYFTAQFYWFLLQSNTLSQSN